MGISTVSHLEHSTSQTHEVECTKRVLPQVLTRGELIIIVIGEKLCFRAGLKVDEVAHDYQVQVKKYVCDDLSLRNSFDTWQDTVICFYLTWCMCIHIICRYQEGCKEDSKDCTGARLFGRSDLVLSAV